MAEVMFGGPEVFHAAVYGRSNPTVYDFIGRQAEHVSNNISQAAQQFFESARGIYEQMDHSKALRRAKAASRRVQNLWQRDGIQPLTTMAALQQAGVDMQRWVMAEPSLRELYNGQQCEGFHSTYIDTFPGTVGEDHYDYRRVMDGIVQENKDFSWQATTYFEDPVPDDVELTLEDQHDIMTTWRFVQAAVTRGRDDPSSPSNEPL